MLECHPFEPSCLERIVAKASGSNRPDAEAAIQVQYLGSFLGRQKPFAKTIVVERDYIDRHYLEEYSGYYATKLLAPTSKVVRLHFFSEKMDDSELASLFEEAARGKSHHERICRQLEDAYLGFSVIRPLPAAPVGRTVLRPYPHGPESETGRDFEPASSQHNVHLAGLTLRVQGLPFQQQEQAVGACATTAIWSALARVVRVDGGRPPTPLAVTTAATRHFLQDRALPAVAGLDRIQMLAALREFGYSPYVLQAKIGELDVFQLAMKCYLRSGIPIVLRVDDKADVGHAVTIGGFREEDEQTTARDIRIVDGSHELRAKGICCLYVHDDRLGPYVRAEWDDKGAAGGPGLRLDPYGPNFDDFKKPVSIAEAIVPHYPKLRLTATDLIRFAVQLVAPAEEIGGADLRGRLEVDLRFALSGSYLEELYSSSLTPARVRSFVQESRLSRYVGIIRFSVDGETFFDAICDTTDIRRDADPWSSVIAFVPSSEMYVSGFAALNERYGIRARVA